MATSHGALSPLSTTVRVSTGESVTGATGVTGIAGVTGCTGASAPEAHATRRSSGSQGAGWCGRIVDDTQTPPLLRGHRRGGGDPLRDINVGLNHVVWMMKGGRVVVENR
jgi:hypothetical protein